MKAKCKMQNGKCKMQNGKGMKRNAERQGNQALAARVPRDLSERLLGFAVRVGKVVNALPATRLGRHIAAQLIRSGTSAAPNYEEGCAAESRADFVHKLSICLKELRESRRWLRLILRVPMTRDEKQVQALVGETEELILIFAKSIKTAKAGGVGR